MTTSRHKSFVTVIAIMTVLLIMGYTVIHMLYNMTYESDALVMMREAIYTHVHGCMSEKYQWYFQTYPHNMVLESLWIGMLNLTGNWKTVEIVGSVLVVFAILLTALSVKNITRSKWATCLTFGIAAFYVGTCYHSLMPYTHNYGIVFPILCLYIYTSKLDFYKKCLLLILAAAVGAEIKMTTLIPLIAIVTAESITWLRSHDWKKAFFALTVFLACFGGIRTLRTPEWRTLGYHQDKTLAVTLPYFLAMGQCTETTGHFDKQCYDLNKACQGQPRKETDKRFWTLAKQRIIERGVWGNVVFFCKKCYRTWGDASMLDHGKTFSNPVMRIIGGTYNIIRQTMMWIFYALIIFLPFRMMKREIFVIYLSLFGVFLYQLLFEAQSHYVYMFCPILVLLAMIALTWLITYRQKHTSKTNKTSLQLDKS